jgi:hypothetical protein
MSEVLLEPNAGEFEELWRGLEIHLGADDAQVAEICR